MRVTTTSMPRSTRGAHRVRLGPGADVYLGSPGRDSVTANDEGGGSATPTRSPPVPAGTGSRPAFRASQSTTRSTSRRQRRAELRRDPRRRGTRLGLWLQSLHPRRWWPVVRRRPVAERVTSRPGPVAVVARLPALQPRPRRARGVPRRDLAESVYSNAPMVARMGGGTMPSVAASLTWRTCAARVAATQCRSVVTTPSRRPATSPCVALPAGRSSSRPGHRRRPDRGRERDRRWHQPRARARLRSRQPRHGGVGVRRQDRRRRGPDRLAVQDHDACGVATRSPARATTT